MDDPTNQPPPVPTTTPQQTDQPPPPNQPDSVFNNNKVIYFLGGVLIIVVILGFIMHALLNNLQATDKTARPTNTPTIFHSPTPSPSPAVSPSPEPTPLPVNPSNVKRKNDLQQLQTALQKYAKERGSYPPQITQTAQAIAKEGADLCQELSSGYIASFPKDPLTEENPNAASGSVKDCTSIYITGYTIVKDAKNKVTIRAPYAEEETISLTF